MLFSLFISVQLPEWACAVQLAVHPERGSDLLQFYLESPVCRPITYAYSVLENTLSIEADHAFAKNETCQVFRLKAKSKVCARPFSLLFFFLRLQRLKKTHVHWV